MTRTPTILHGDVGEPFGLGLTQTWPVVASQSEICSCRGSRTLTALWRWLVAPDGW